MHQLLKCTDGSTFKHLILVTPLNLCLLRNMSVLAPKDLRDHDCERGKVTQQPPISYAQFKYKPWISKLKKIKLKLGEGNTFTCNLMNNSSNAQSYLKWILFSKEEKKLNKKVAAASSCSKRF